MQGYGEPFKGKKVTLLGLGLLGRGVGDADFLASCGAHLLVTDMRSATDLAPSIEKLKHHSNISYRLGEHQESDFTSADIVIKGAKTPADSAYIAAAKSAGVPVLMSTAYVAKYAMELGSTVIGVTGTRGKTTVTHMIHHVLTETTDPSTVHIGGNIRGVSTMSLLPNIKKGDTLVLELDSWQLQGFGDLNISPNTAVFTNLMPDHLDYYRDMDEYFADKANIFKFQKQGDHLIVGKNILEKVKSTHPPVEPIVPEPIPREWLLEIPGDHNRENAALARAALLPYMGEPEIKASLASFQGVEGRLQFVRDVEGSKIYNDNNATTPEATIAALKSLDKNIALIVGGSEKGLALDALVDEIKSRSVHVIVLAHDGYKGSLRLMQSLREKGVQYVEAADLPNALNVALALKPSTVLFSPAFASFGMFKNEYERNDQFLALVEKL